MANISDLIAGAIMDMLQGNDIAEIQRNDLAEKIGCVPSQINYVLTSRFKPEQGFIIESKRGGGGFIRIKKLNFCEDEATQIMHIVNSIGPYIDISSCSIILKNMITRELISQNNAQLIMSGISNSALKNCDAKFTSYLRADIFKNMLVTVANNLNR